ncbi:P-loop containing nucleoside triphosphate hydrolase protein [Xylariaceae sp. AK1471]|nr:P-loop containing nucleoside triphosphate hydrolase protein [Xylariaceae sp. AK1471]
MVQPFHVGGAAAGPLFGPGRPGISLIRNLFEKAFKVIDASRATHALTVWHLGTSVIPNLLDILYTLRHYVRIFFTSSVTIKASDELYLQVFNWLATRESQRRFIKEYTAQTLSDGRTKTTAMVPGRRGLSLPGAVSKESSRIKYIPAFKTTWFFHRCNLFAILRNDKQSSAHNAPTAAIPVYDYFGPVAMADHKESVTITCLGWSTVPIQNLLENCRDMAEENRRTSVTIRSCRDQHWELSAVKPVRSLDTIHLEQDVKDNLISDLEKYLDPQRRHFYSEQGIPYRRGYLLHGPPGCGKSSLSLALAGKFGLDLYMVNLSTLYDGDLESLFAMLPARCIVLLEDIDAVGFKRPEDDDDEVQKRVMHRRSHKCSLSSLLNVLDGVASQEGRVVIMTSNLPDQLDEALVRPGRIDVKIHMGHITPRGAEQIFLRMMKTGMLDKASSGAVSDDTKAGNSKPENDDQEDEQNQNRTDEDLQALAKQFSEHIPEATFTPAQLQGYLLQYLHSATTAVDKIAAWVADEKRKVVEEAERKEQRRKEKEEKEKEKEKEAETTTNNNNNKTGDDRDRPVGKRKHSVSSRAAKSGIIVHFPSLEALVKASTRITAGKTEDALDDEVHEVA